MIQQLQRTVGYRTEMPLDQQKRKNCHRNRVVVNAADPYTLGKDMCRQRIVPPPVVVMIRGFERVVQLTPIVFQLHRTIAATKASNLQTQGPTSTLSSLAIDGDKSADHTDYDFQLPMCAGPRRLCIWGYGGRQFGPVNGRPSGSLE